MLEVRNLSKNFLDLQVLEKVSLKIESNKTTAIIGPSGSGKSTLLRCMNLLEIPSGGLIEFDGLSLDFDNKEKKVTKQEMIKLRRKTGMVFQSFNLFPHMTVLENIMEGPLNVLKRSKREVVKEAEELLGKVGLTEKRDSYPIQLSGGQQQRIAIARALAMKPEIMLFDEPTSALDPELEVEVLKLIRELAEDNYTIVIVTHKMSFAREVSHQVVFLENGKILMTGKYDELYHSSNTRINTFLRNLE